MVDVEAALALRTALVQGVIGDDDTACCIYDLGALDARLD